MSVPPDEVYLRFELNIKNKQTMRDAIDDFFGSVTLHDGICEICVPTKRGLTVVKKMEITEPPKVVCIVLNRFIHGVNIHIKLDHHVRFEDRLRREELFVINENDGKSPDGHYRLVSMIEHIGQSSDSGHYIAICASNDGSYFRFDDSTVTPISVENMLKSKPYVLFYQWEQNEIMEKAAGQTAYCKNADNWIKSNHPFEVRFFFSC